MVQNLFFLEPGLLARHQHKMAFPAAQGVTAVPCKQLHQSGLLVHADIGSLAAHNVTKLQKQTHRTLGSQRIKARRIPQHLASLRRASNLRVLSSDTPSVVTEENAEPGSAPVQAVLFDMDGVLCDSEEPSRAAAVALFAEMGYAVTAEDFVPFMGTGESTRIHLCQ